MEWHNRLKFRNLVQSFESMRNTIFQISVRTRRGKRHACGFVELCSKFFGDEFSAGASWFTCTREMNIRYRETANSTNPCARVDVVSCINKISILGQECVCVWTGARVRGFFKFAVLRSQLFFFSRERVKQLSLINTFKTISFNLFYFLLVRGIRETFVLILRRHALSKCVLEPPTPTNPGRGRGEGNQLNRRIDKYVK